MRGGVGGGSAGEVEREMRDRRRREGLGGGRRRRVKWWRMREMAEMGIWWLGFSAKEKTAEQLIRRPRRRTQRVFRDVGAKCALHTAWG